MLAARTTGNACPGKTRCSARAITFARDMMRPWTVRPLTSASIPMTSSRWGKFFTNDLPFRVVESDATFQVLPPANGRRSAWVTSAVIGAAFAAALWAAMHYMPARDPQRPFAIFGISAIGLMTVMILLGFGFARQNYFERRGPVIDYDKATGRFRIPGGRTFDRSDVVGLLCCALLHKGSEQTRLAELNFVAHVDGKRLRFLLLTLLDGQTHAFDYIARPFIAATGLPAYRIWNEGFFGGGPLRAEKIGPLEPAVALLSD